LGFFTRQCGLLQKSDPLNPLKSFKLDHFTRFYLKLAGKQVFFNPSNVLTYCFKNCNLALKTAISPGFHPQAESYVGMSNLPLPEAEGFEGRIG
jgi:hypothetical protein